MWFGHKITRREETSEARASIEYKQVVDPKKRWTDGVRQDLERLELVAWEERIQDHDYWRSVTAAAKTLT